VTFVDGGDAGHEVAFSLRLPYLNSGGKSASRCAGDTDTFAKLLTAIFRLIVAHDAATNEISIIVENPEGIEPGCKGALEEFVCGFRGVHLRLPGQIAEAGQCSATEIVHERLGQFGGDFEGPGGTSGRECG